MLNWWNQLKKSSDFRSEHRKRQALAAALGMVALTSFVEVVLLPGAVVRGNNGRMLGAEASAATSVERGPTPAETHPTLQLVESLTESPEARERKAEQRRAAERNALHRRVTEAQQSLRAAMGSTERDWSAFVTDLRQHQGVDLARAPFDPKTQPRELNLLVLRDSTAAAAWANIRQLPNQVLPALKAAGALLDATSDRMAADSTNAADIERLHATQRSVEALNKQIRQGRRDLDHLDVLSRANRLMSSF